MPEISLFLDNSSSNNGVSEINGFLLGFERLSVCEWFVHALNNRESSWTAQALITKPDVSFLPFPLALRPTITPFGSRNRKSLASPSITGFPR